MLHMYFDKHPSKNSRSTEFGSRTAASHLARCVASVAANTPATIAKANTTPTPINIAFRMRDTLQGVTS